MDTRDGEGSNSSGLQQPRLQPRIGTAGQRLTSHRDDQLAYYLRLAAAAHSGSRVDLTYITGALSKPAPALLSGQRYGHLTWDQVLTLIEAVWGCDERPEVAAVRRDGADSDREPEGGRR